MTIKEPTTHELTAYDQAKRDAYDKDVLTQIEREEMKAAEKAMQDFQPSLNRKTRRAMAKINRRK